MTENAVKAAIARVTRKPVRKIDPYLTLASLGVTASVGVSAVQNILEAEAGRKLPPLQTAMSVMDVVALLTGNAEGGVSSSQPIVIPPAAPTIGLPPQPAAVFSGGLANFGMGMDLQKIDDLPQTDDFRSEPFYNENFRPEEISAALLRSNPRQHLCGIFCAKEAARKSHPALMRLRMGELLVVHSEAGQPTAEVVAPIPNRFSFLISITHSGDYAAASCLSHCSAG